jgi:hypothetical protein
MSNDFKQLGWSDMTNGEAKRHAGLARKMQGKKCATKAGMKNALARYVPHVMAQDLHNAERHLVR